MKGLRRKFERFCYMNRNKGIPNLMLYIVLGCGIVSALDILGYNQIYNLLCFDRNAILHGQVWRLISFIFTMSSGNILMTLLLLYCYYSLGNALERTWGTLRFNLFYFTGILLMDIFAMVFGGIPVTVEIGNYKAALDFSDFYAGSMINYLHLSMLICYATAYPETQFYVFFFIPVKAWILALIYLGVTLFEVVQMSVPNWLFPHNLFPLVAFANYFLFFGKDIQNLFPLSWRYRKKRPASPRQTGTVSFQGKKNTTPCYTHRCTVCGRTDATNPELEFRYCSRCNGYFCYCEDHINNHTHME